MKPTAEAPERIWLCPQNYETATACGHPNDTEYVRADLFASAIASEREKAAKVAEAHMWGTLTDGDVLEGVAKMIARRCKEIAAAIRAGDKE